MEMKGFFVWMFVFCLMFSFVFAQDGWGDINEGDSVESGVEFVVTNDKASSSEDGKFFTKEFYIAIIIIIIVLIVIGVFVWLFIRGPKDKWK